MKDIERIFFLSLLLYIRVVTGNGPSPVIGCEYGSVLLPCSLSFPVIEAIWDFSFNGRSVKVADFRNQKFSIIRKEFHSRMEWSHNGITLTITNLTMEDTGIYTALIYDTEYTKHEISHNLTVFNLVPKPEIKREECKGDGQCDYTLHCSVPSDSPALSYSWKYRDKNSEYHHYAHGSTIQISSPNETMTFLCLVQNPAQENNSTVVIERKVNAENERLQVAMMIAPGFAALVLAAVVFLCVRMRRENKKKEDITYSDIQSFPQGRTNEKEDITYIAIQAFPQERTDENLMIPEPLLCPVKTYVEIKRYL
ncbi:hypothetical protein XELAEV_18000256mg [Xenopus laevis]|uniref:Ig-like domain-containing protein n=1 Tax=Xenopus laevis TaxID=8355 RepID=A0A974GZA7_XENLA|nr:hypothetical protein XELAEV_18000256mg [Xenopus laevis]